MAFKTVKKDDRIGGDSTGYSDTAPRQVESGFVSTEVKMSW